MFLDLQNDKVTHSEILLFKPNIFGLLSFFSAEV